MTTAEQLREDDRNLHGLIVTKLATVIERYDIPNWFVNLSKCGKHQGTITCRTCNTDRPLVYRCSQKWCPNCNWTITQARAERLREWAKAIRRPMHLVLTQRNFKELTPGKLQEHTDNLRKIRAREPMASRARAPLTGGVDSGKRLRKWVKKTVINGGCVSVEVTNKTGEGWHLHSHWLIDSGFISMGELSKAWAELVGQEFAIVHYNDNKDKNFVSEVCKYVCKPAEMVSWTALEILAFIESSRHRRFFFTFGSLTKMRKGIEASLAMIKPIRVCRCKECGSESLDVNVSKGTKEWHRSNAVALVERF